MATNGYRLNRMGHVIKNTGILYNHTDTYYKIMIKKKKTFLNAQCINPLHHHDVLLCHGDGSIVVVTTRVFLQ